MQVEKFNYNDRDDLCSNTYVISDSQNHALVVDPAVDNDGIINFLVSKGLTPLGILLTHGHFDHIRGVKRLVDKYQIPVYIHALESDLLTDTYKNCSEFCDCSVIIDVKDKVVEINDKQVLKILEKDIIVIHTPYHTEGSVCYYFPEEKLLFSGDTLFKGSVGRSDLPTSCRRKERETFNKLKSLPEDTKVYPGHESNTTIGYELSFNRFLNN